MARTVTVEPLLFVFMFVTFTNYPLLEQLIYQKLCLNSYNETVCHNIHSQGIQFESEENFIQKQTSSWMFYQSCAITITSVFSTLIFGAISDRVGRKLFLILPCIGLAVQSITLLLSSHYFESSLNWILVGNVICGCFGSFSTLLTAVFAYMADITDPGKRTVRISILESMSFLGNSLGELTGGVIVDHSGYLLAFSLALGLSVLSVFYTIFLPESYYSTERISISKLFKSNTFIGVFKVIFKKRPNKQRSSLIILLSALFLMMAVFVGTNDIAILYSMHTPLKFSPSMIGYFLSVLNGIKGIGVLLIVPLLIKKLRLSDLTTSIIGNISMMSMYVYFGFASRLWMMFTGPLIGIGGGIPVPCLRALMSKMVERDETGSLFAAIAVVEVLCVLFAASLFNNVYKATVSWYAGFSFFVMATVLLVPHLLLWYLQRRSEKQKLYIVLENEHTVPTLVDSDSEDHSLPVVGPNH